MSLLSGYSATQLYRFLADALSACAAFDIDSEAYGDAAAEVRMIQAELERRVTPSGFSASDKEKT